MTGLDLIIYIFKNDLENEQVIKDGRILGFTTARDAAAKLDIGTASVKALASLRDILSYKVGDETFFAAHDIDNWIASIERKAE